MVLHVFVDTEFTSLLDPHLLPVGLVTPDGREHCVELDLASEFRRARLAITPWDVRENILDKFGAMPDAKCDSEWKLGQRVGTWLLRLAEGSPDGRIELLYDYGVDYELLVSALDECNLWPQVRVAASQANIGAQTGTLRPELASDATFRALRRRTPSLLRHHALEDALALRAALQTWHSVQERSRDFVRLLEVVGRDQEEALYEWLATPTPALGDRTPLDVIAEPDGLARVEASAIDMGGRK
jgi:uncharacterized protein (DUF2384 family)